MKELPLSNRKANVIVDDNVFNGLAFYRWNVNNAGYAGAWIDGKQVLLHRFIMGAKDGEEVDHINGNRFDCRVENMRLCTHSQNIANDGPRTNNKLGVKGVDYHGKKGKYRATIRVNYKKIHLGVFDTLKDAAIAYNEGAKKYYGEFAYQNNIELL